MIPSTYRITFKGSQPPETLDAAKGKRLYDAWLADNLPSRIELRRGLAVSSQSIKSVEYVPAGKETTKFDDNAYDDFMRDFLSLPPEKKAAHLERFKTYYRFRMMRSKGKNYRDCVPDANVLERARAIQEAYYRKNNRVYEIPLAEYGDLLTGVTENLVAELA